MRMVARARPNIRDEEGATILIVFIALIAILGMLILVVDVGGDLMMRRQMVTAADSAALAAAQSCGKHAGEPAATDQADTLAHANVSAAQRVSIKYEPYCNAAAGQVTVTYRADQVQVFAPIFGTGKTRPVTAAATATWGGVGVGNIVPFMLSEGALSSCDIPNGVSTDQVCTFWLNNREGLGNSQWAMLNLNPVGSSRWGWNVARDYSSCNPANTSETLGWINNSSPPLSLNYPEPTFVCVDTGATPPTFEALAALASPPQIREFPVNDPDGRTDVQLGTSYGHGQVNKTGQPCPPPRCVPGDLGPIDKYDIVGFAQMEILSVQRGNRGGELTCNMPRDSNAWCLKAMWKGFVTDPTGSTNGGNFGVIALRLIA